jgi:hypothetical protein
MSEFERTSHEDLAKIFAERKKAKIITTSEIVLESEVEVIENKVYEVRDGVKVRVRITDETVKTRRIVIREFDPEASYEDGLNEFVDES